MNSSAPASVLCPRCARSVARLFEATGLCARCASERVFALAADEPSDCDVAAPALPTKIGAYTIIDELGHGGMGTVYLAQHTQLGRVVALKAIRTSGAAGSDFELRFLREARTAAALRHPNIVAVHDAGRAGGYLFFAMDYVAGGDLAGRLRERRPFAPRDAARLLRCIADAIAYSHTAGVLHRDLKPSNILLDGDEPRVADFGLAAQVEPSGALTTATAMLGTPHYLAPEALRGRRADRGPASDIYALGVILYELLAGRTPFAGASLNELPILLERCEAPALKLLAPQVPADLATICAKCLEIEPSNRYATAAALTDDLARFLAGEPIVARPISAPTQLFRWARRRPALAATWMLSCLLAVASFTAAVWINRERVRADREAAGSAALADFLQKDLLVTGSSSEAPDRDMKLRTALDRAVERIPGRFPDTPLAEAGLRFSLGTTYYSLGEYARAEKLFRETTALRRIHLGVSHLDTLRAAIELTIALTSLGRNDEALALIRATRTELTRVAGPDAPATIKAMETHSHVERALGHLVVAEAIGRQALATARRTLEPDHELTRHSMDNLVALLAGLKKFSEATTLARDVVGASMRALGPLHPQTLAAEVDLAGLESEQGHFQEAAAKLGELHATLVRQLGAEHPVTLHSATILAVALGKLERHAEAETLLSGLVDTYRRVHGQDHPATLEAIKLLALARGRNGNLDGAIELMRELAQTSAAKLGPAHASTLNYQRNVAAMLLSAKRYDEGLVISRQVYTASVHEFGADNGVTLTDGEVFANALVFTGQFAEAEPLWRQMTTAWHELQPDNWRADQARGNLGKTLVRLGRHAEAESFLREAYANLSAKLATVPPPRRNLPGVYAEQLALVCTQLGRAEEAAEWKAKAGASGAK